MRAIASFRKDIYSPVLETLNVSGMGVEHISTKTQQWASMQGYGYWETKYHCTDNNINKLMMKHGTPYIKEKR